jgi:hypothetical protein
MSIPIRLWRALRGRIALARERGSVSQVEVEAALERAAIAQAEADAARELAEHTVGHGHGVVPPGEASAAASREQGVRRGEEARLHSRPVAPSPRRPVGQPSDPFAEDYALLQLAPGSGLAALEAAYQARLEEVRPDRHPEGSAERAVAESRRRAIAAAYERLRDALNTTETRFEKLEF